MYIRGIPVALVAFMLCLGPVSQAWGSTPYSSPNASDINLLTPPSVGLTEQQVGLLSNVNGHFVENLGQYGPGAGMFYAAGDPLSVALGSGWASYYHIGDGTGEGVMVRMDLLGARAVEPVGIDPLSYPTNYLKGNDPDKWVVGARSFREVHFREIYDGIDLVYRFDAGMLKYDIHVRPHADISQVKMGYSGQDSLRVDSVTGDLVIGTPVVDLVDRAPVSYQDDTAGSDKISTRFILADEGTVSFEVTGHDPGLPLVIDPILPVFSTFIGGSGGENPWDFLIDEGDILVAGSTQSSNFPTTPGVIQRRDMVRQDGFILKLKDDGSDLIFSTLIGGSGLDHVTQISLDKDRNIIALGVTSSTDFPTTPGAYEDTLQYTSAIYVMKVDSECTNIEWSTFLVEGSLGSIAIMSNGDVMVAGSTYVSNFPIVPGCFDETHNDDYDVILIRMDPNGTRIIKSTYIGGSGYDATEVAGMSIDDDDNVYVSMLTTSTDLPVTPDAYSKNASGGSDGAILKIDSNLSELEYMTYLGGTGYDDINSIDVDASGAVYVIGSTESSDFPTTDGAFDEEHNSPGTNDTYIARLAPNGSSLSFSTFIGGRSDDIGQELRIGSGGLVYYAIWTYSTLMPTTKKETDSIYGGKSDVYVGVLDAQNQSIRYGTYIGGTGYDGQFLFIDLYGDDVILSGSTASPLFPTTEGAYDQTHNRVVDVFVTRFVPKLSITSPPGPPVNLKAIQEGRSVSLDWDRPINDGNLNLWPYRVHRGLSDKNFSDTWDVQPWFTEWNDTLPEDGVTFYYAVTANSPAGESALSNIVNVVNATLPDPPLDLAAEAGCGTVMLTWSVPGYTGGVPIRGYHIWRGTDPDDLVHLRTVTDGLSFEDEGLENGDRYYYGISAFNDEGNSSISFPTISIVPVGPPGVPRGLYITAGDGMLNLWWRRPVNDGGRTITGYQVLRGKDRNALTIVAQVDNSTTSYVDSPLVNGVTYYYAVRAVNEEGEGVLSPIVSRVPKGPPGAPMHLTGLPNIGEVELSWEPPGPGNGSTLVRYSLFKGTSENGLEHLVDVNGNTTSYVDRDLEYGRMTYYAVSATNVFRDGPISTIIQIWPVKLPDPPGDLHARDDLESVMLTWQDPLDNGGSDVIGYAIYRGTSIDDLSSYDSVGAGNLSFTDTRATEVQVYYYKVATVTSVGEGRHSIVVNGKPFRLPSEPPDLIISYEDGNLKLSWEPPSDLGGTALLLYRIYKGTGSDPMVLLTELAEGTTFIDDDLSEGQVHYYSVSAVTRAGEGPPSDVARFDPSVLVDRPGPPKNLHADPDEGRVRLTWDPPDSNGGSPVTGYVIYRGTSPTDLSEVAWLGDVLTYEDTGVEEDRTYHYCVAAVNDVAGVGEVSRTVEAHLVETGTGTTLSGTTIVLIIIVIVIITFAAAAWAVEPVKYSLILLLLPLFSRFTREAVMDNKNRHSIHGLIIDNPGIHFNGIMKEYDISAGVATYHLNVLERENFIHSARDGRLKRFYSTHTKIPNGRLRKTPEEVRLALIDLVKDRPGISQMELIQELGIKRYTISYHLAMLVKEGVLEPKRKGKYTVYSANGHR